VPSDTLFAFQSAPLPPASAGVVPLMAFTLTVSPSAASPFGREVTIELPYDPAGLAALGFQPAALVVVVVRPDGTLEWLPTQADPVAQVVRARTSHFSEFALVASQATPPPATRRLMVPVVSRRGVP
jgi:hypothetical protein